MAYLVAITIGTGILFGLVPALRLSKLDFNAALKDGGHGSTTGLRGRHLSTVLVIAEMSLAFVLLVGVKLADPLTYVTVLLMLTMASVLGCAFPARRAARVDPIVALRRNLPK
jgi:ABC-type antimicrobial peptide transport system permease subunit